MQKCSVKYSGRHELITENKEIQNYCPSANQLSTKEGPSYFILLPWSAKSKQQYLPHMFEWATEN